MAEKHKDYLKLFADRLDPASSKHFFPKNVYMMLFSSKKQKIQKNLFVNGP